MVTRSYCLEGWGFDSGALLGSCLAVFKGHWRCLFTAHSFFLPFELVLEVNPLSSVKVSPDLWLFPVQRMAPH